MSDRYTSFVIGAQLCIRLRTLQDKKIAQNINDPGYVFSELDIFYSVRTYIVLTQLMFNLPTMLDEGS